MESKQDPLCRGQAKQHVVLTAPGLLRAAKFFWYLFFMFIILFFFTCYGMTVVAVVPNIQARPPATPCLRILLGSLTNAICSHVRHS